MHYCFVAKTKVYSCDHYDCNNCEEAKTYGTEIYGMKWCSVAGTHVYSCDHYDCNH